MGVGLTWKGPNGGDWGAADNWYDIYNVTATVSPDIAADVQFLVYTGSVTGSMAAHVLYVGAGSDLTLGGDGTFGSVVVGEDYYQNVGVATLQVASGFTVSASVLSLGDAATGGDGALVVSGKMNLNSLIMSATPGAAGTVHVLSGGAVFDRDALLMNDGGLIQVDMGGSMVLGSSSASGASGALTIDSLYALQGEGTINANVVLAANSSLISDNNGFAPTVLTVNGDISGGGGLSVFQEMDVNGAIGAGVQIAVQGDPGLDLGKLVLEKPDEDAGTFIQLNAGSTIALAGKSFDSAVWNAALNELDLNGAGGTLALKTAGDYSTVTFTTQADAAIGGTDILIEPLCFLSGTRILTAHGEVAVETLKTGDLIVACDGRELPLRWLGRQNFSKRFADPLRAWPVRIRAGALEEGVPARDLLVSPDHAVYVDGALIHAGALVNGTSIVRERDVPEKFVYFHVELDEHTLIFAEGAPAESFVDNVDRLAFDNWSEHCAAFPDGHEVAQLPYPRAKSRRQVPMCARARLEGRAAIIGAVPEMALVS